MMKAKTRQALEEAEIEETGETRQEGAWKQVAEQAYVMHENAR